MDFNSITLRPRRGLAPAAPSGGAGRFAAARLAGLARQMRALASRFMALRESYFLDHTGDFPARLSALARVGVEARLWGRLLVLLPVLAPGLLRREPDVARRVKTALGIGIARPAAAIDLTFLSRGPAPPPDLANLPPVQVIMPVFNAFDLLKESLSRIVAHTDLPWRLILVEDRSTDRRVRPWLRGWVEQQEALVPGRITLLENARNLGFVGAVNRAFGAVRRGAGPVVLLNSDAMVPPDWASRLTAPLRDNRVATATPFTNDGEIFSVPIIAARSQLQPGQADRIDAALRRRLARGGEFVTVPTGVGFCMAIGEDWFWRIGHFDPAFGRGYGEETDWCQRAALAGGQHVAVPNLFVEHRGGASFGAEKRARLRESGAIISARYPGYDRSVRRFIRDDPLATARFAAALAWAETMGGAGELATRLARDPPAGPDARSRPGGVSLSVVLDAGPGAELVLSTPHGRAVILARTADALAALLAPIANLRLTDASGVPLPPSPFADPRAAGTVGVAMLETRGPHRHQERRTAHRVHEVTTRTTTGAAA